MPIIDSRKKTEYVKGHIEGAVLVPLRELGQNFNLLPSFDTPIIAYCGSGWRATIAMTALEAMGWTEVKVLKGGSFSGWVEAGYPFVEGVPPEAAVLNAAAPDAALAAEMDAMLSSVPEGFGVAFVAPSTRTLPTKNSVSRATANAMPTEIGLPGRVSYALNVQGDLYEPAKALFLLFIFVPCQIGIVPEKRASSAPRPIHTDRLWLLPRQTAATNHPFG